MNELEVLKQAIDMVLPQDGVARTMRITITSVLQQLSRSETGRQRLREVLTFIKENWHGETEE